MPGRYSKPVYGHGVPWWAYDIAIGAMLLSSFQIGLWWLALDQPWPAAACGLFFAVIFYGSFIEPKLLRVRRYDIGSGERTLKVAFLSDIHVGPYKGSAWVRRLARATNALAPDVVLLGGDFLEEKARDLPKLLPLKELRAPLGVYAILGNHDEYKANAETRAFFAREGLPLFLNVSKRLPHVGAEVAVAGADDDWYGETDLDAAFRGVPADIPLVAMLHNPDLAPPAAGLLRGRTAPTVLFSGHTHAGQIRLPLIGAVPKLPHHLGRRFDRGVFPMGEATLVIGAGAGESGPRARLFCPPEIVLVTVRF